ncbi:MAG: TetR/AcrR family transcriptional regulator [Pseudomonadales bacterium]|jgi:AcrR family transcriptional regulator|nr:TetR/AcrR family transcriptional regulator [Pseudomonadales bacterium]MDC0174589.1 TetR/AcrR family transcriptional regulator [Pseudomonadales bacterium]|tara:strand:- start:758 stop:1348 length:591 start_codon:yes stop_codon:yes gene_type:complete
MARGRPRQFDEDEALTGAMLLFWEKGLSATSLDDLAIAMNMNRPSIYNAFGNKDAIYRKSLARFCGQLDKGMQETLDASTSVDIGLNAFFEQAIEVYCGSNPQMGCLMICTAPSEAVSNPEVGKDLKDLISRLDVGLSQRLARAQRNGEISVDLQPKLTAKLLQATLQTIALRARTGEPKASLRKLARYAVKTLVH